VRRPMDQVVQARGDEHTDRVNSPSNDLTLANADMNDSVPSAGVPEGPDIPAVKMPSAAPSAASAAPAKPARRRRARRYASPISAS
jgi:hypothetical protein